MFQLELTNAIWLFVVLFMLHDFEEIITVEKWAPTIKSKIKANRLHQMIWQFWNVNSYSFAKRDVFIFLTMATITFLKVQNFEAQWSSVLYVSFLIFVLVHNVVHVVQTCILNAYTPGLYTAMFLVTPYAIYLLTRLT
ncbi:HXXEE domain-containing protein [Paenibacillus sp. 481]|uniref:HXXEE domain-containing protein n=1 Tax=Paenibacillus sp. 481 TaxID=2835869 RepID=UPI001E5FBCD6|nr:HXXEE domain-containing protein [Paenibacillus sp. 481]UHA72734.1 HXXEE domain-containing protein [Paenibacillus sp. 481]